jgi:hypothetical protein
VPERYAQERLADWRAAERAESVTEDGSVARRRATAKTRRARWKFEDAARAAADDHGGLPERFQERQSRTLRRLQEASETSAELHRGHRGRRAAASETLEQHDKRVADDAEIARELGS